MFQSSIKSLLLVALITAGLCLIQNASAREKAKQAAKHTPLQCVAFSPYVDGLTPDYGAQPSPELIDRLLDQLLKETPFRCIMTYGVMNGLEHTFAAAQARKIKVIAIIWLDNDIEVNSRSITAGINAAKTYADTIIKISCGTEVRTRNDYAFDGEISRCLAAMREAGVKQALTTIDIWWEWCNRESPCHRTNFGDQVDWIGINAHAWWENRHSGLYPCIPAKKVADFNIEMVEKIRKTYPGKDVVITEFGWPNRPEGGTAINKVTGQRCAVAGKKNQAQVVKSTFKKLAKKGWDGIVFEAFSENWKPAEEGEIGRYWGICEGEPPYACGKF